MNTYEKQGRGGAARARLTPEERQAEARRYEMRKQVPHTARKGRERVRDDSAGACKPGAPMGTKYPARHPNFFQTYLPPGQ